MNNFEKIIEISCEDLEKISGGNDLIDDGDYQLEDACKGILKIESDRIFVCGSDAALFIERIKELVPAKKFLCLRGTPNETENLFAIAEEMMDKKIPTLKDFDGPVYIRASEAEENLTARSNNASE